jgi:hypothetical protein
LTEEISLTYSSPKRANWWETFSPPSSLCDTSALSLYQLDLPEGAWTTGDKAYNGYMVEDILREAGIELLPTLAPSLLAVAVVTIA